MISYLISLPTLSIILGILYAFKVVVYNVFMHPLRKYPGPLYHRVNGWVLAYHIWKGDLFKHMRNLHEKYGSVVRVGPNELSYIGEQAWTDIYGHQLTPGRGNIPKELKNFRKEENGSVTILSSNDIDHRRFRRIQSHMFSEKAINAQEAYIQGYVDLLISRLLEKALSSSNIVDIAKWYNFTTIDIIGELAFGEPFDCLKYGRSDAWLEAIQLTLKDASVWFACGKFPWPLGSLLYRLTPNKIQEVRKRGAQLAERKVKDRIVQSSDERIDFMSYILKHKGEKGMTPAEIDSNARLYILAGSETTAVYLSGLTYYLLVNDKHLKKLTHLIRNTFHTEKDICLLELNKLEYFTAIIEETFRLYPPVTGGLTRRVIEGGNVICDEVVPENTLVSVHIYASNMSSSNWTDPEKFVPERWFRDDKCPERYRSDKRKSMQQFSYGPRNCIGKNMAYSELRIIFARMIWNFDLELDERCLDWKNHKAFVIWERKPLYVKLIPRNHK